MVSNPAEKGHMEILERHNISLEWIENKLNMYNKSSELKTD